jgi:hypothetical protein
MPPDAEVLAKGLERRFSFFAAPDSPETCLLRIPVCSKPLSCNVFRRCSIWLHPPRSGPASIAKPWVTDFGFARSETDATLTVSGDLLGTVRYMSPEQALAKRIVVDHRTDVYSLGVNGLIERAQRTIGEALEEEDLETYHRAVRAIDKVIAWYNEERLHSALGFLRPIDYYRGDPAALHEERRRKMARARRRRKDRRPQLGLL